MPSTTTHAFTLLELLVVIAIIGLLSSLVITQVRSARDKAHYAKALQFSAHLDRTLGAEAVGIWNFEEGTGTTATDVSGWGNHGTIHGATYTTETYNDEVSGYALSFDGVDDYVAGLGARVEGDTTFSAWIHTSNTSKGEMVILLGGGGWTTRLEFFLRMGYLRLSHGDGSSYAWYTSPDIVATGTWKHVVWTAEYPTASFYIDGKKVEDYNMPFPVDSFLLNNMAGASGYQDIRCWDGYMDDVRIYQSSLTAHEIKSHYLAGIEKLYAHGAINEEEYRERLSMVQ